MNQDYKETKQKLERLLQKRLELENEIRHVVIEYVQKKSDMSTMHILGIGYKNIIRTEFNLEI